MTGCLFWQKIASFQQISKSSPRRDHTSKLKRGVPEGREGKRNGDGAGGVHILEDGYRMGRED